MNPATADLLAVLKQQREEADTQRTRAEKAYALAVLDETAALIRDLCPEAVYVNFAYYGSTRTLVLYGVLGEQSSPLGTCPWLWEESDQDHPLAEHGEKIALDLQEALAPYNSPAWARTRRNSASKGNDWLLELPPPDRAARIAELVREHHPEATAVVVDGRSAGGRIIEVIEGVTEDGSDNRTTRRRWNERCDDLLTALVAQMFALPELADRHLLPVGSTYAHPYGSSISDHVRRMPLPPTA
ncbi:hypothetical protein [Streptomyces gossypiisoli]|uniref:hypothetical protein n=1 Tax=Streptomyces gossypiisoli TaxID=2748864 RepID=UPI0015DA06DE|nr:hypothetical protein [Streptomyces gossypiisoli]